MMTYNIKNGVKLLPILVLLLFTLPLFCCSDEWFTFKFIQPEIITKKFMLAGFETAIDMSEFGLGESHTPGIDYVKSSLKANIDKIGNKVEPIRYIGVLIMDPKVDYSNPENDYKYLYFYGVEVANLDDIPESCVIKDFPESTFEVGKGSIHGLCASVKSTVYTYNIDFISKFAAAMLIYNDIDGSDLEWNYLTPIKKIEESTEE